MLFTTSVPQIISYYPKYIYLDKVLEQSGLNKVKIYVDIKNCFQGLYLEPFARQIISNSLRSRHLDSSIFESFLEFVSFHKVYARKRGIELEMFFFFDFGKSEYHHREFPTYKENRIITDMFQLGEEYNELYRKVIKKNLDLILNLGNRLPGVFVVKLDYCETDFIPYYLINRVFNDSTSYVHIIYSNDKDMYQTLNDSNIFQYVRKKNKIEIINSKDTYRMYLKEDIPLDPSYIVLLMSINGDMGDSVPGIKGIAEKTISKHWTDIPQLFGTMDNVYERIKLEQPLINQYHSNSRFVSLIKDNESIIRRNVKLISFKLISDWIDSNSTTTLIQKKNSIHSSVCKDKKTIRSGKVIYDAFEKVGISLSVSESTINNLFD
ncbi:MAG: hypothetical protein QXG00_06070 [Candidatus Woesearchaeota archaeon]